MAFRIDDLSVRLMSPDKNKDESRDKPKPPKPKDDSSHKGDQGHGCTMATADTYQIQKTKCPGKSEGGVEALALLQAQLRETLAPPPL